MPNAGAMIYESTWWGDFRKLSRRAQCLYQQLCAQGDLNCAGLLPLQPDKWAAGCDELTVADVWADLNELQDSRWVLYDADTFQAFIRDHLHKPFIIKSPNCRQSAMRSARLCTSPSLRAALAAELRATGREDFAAVADEIDPSETLPEPVETPSETIPKSNPSETLPKPPSTSTSMSTSSHLGNYSSGCARPLCSKHPQGDADDNCRGCRKVRLWDEQNAATAAARARSIAANCPDCHGTNVIEVDDDLVVKCNHPNATQEVA